MILSIGLAITGLIGMVFLFGYVQRKRGAAKVKNELLTQEIELVRKANKIRQDRKHINGDDVIGDL